MPRKRRTPKTRYADGFPLHSLSICDCLHIACGLPARDRIFPCDRIKNMDNMRQAWEENREAFLQVCTCRSGGLACEQHRYATEPGCRPFAWWIFEKGYDPEDIPGRDEQRAELERMAAIGALEREELAKIDRKEAERAALLASLGKHKKQVTH